MKIGVRLFLSSMVFAIAIAAIYAYATRDVVGTAFLGFMALALVVLAGYVIVSEREADLASDRADATPAESAGENLGVFALESYWPILAAVAIAIILPATVFLPGVSGIFVVFGFGLLVFALRFMIREST